MYSIQVDEEVFALLQKNAKAFIDSPNTALRRLLGLPATGANAEAENQTENFRLEATANRRGKAPKASLRTLVDAGLLKNGERLYLVDYQGQRDGTEAVIAGNLLQYKGQHQTMSNLAQVLLKKQGFKADSVRGPAHWVTTKGVSVKDLWQQLLDQKTKAK